MSSVLVLCGGWVGAEEAVFLSYCFLYSPFCQLSVSEVLYGAQQFSARTNKHLSIYLSIYLYENRAASFAYLVSIPSSPALPLKLYLHKLPGSNTIVPKNPRHPEH